MLADGSYPIPGGKVAEVVTHLKMDAPVAIHDVPLPDGVTFRPVTADVAWFRDIFARVGQPWLWFGRQVLTDEALSDIITDPKVVHYTLTLDNTDEALLELDFRVEEACELSYFGLTPKLIGTGAGRYLMNKAIALAWEQDITKFHVHTCTLDSPQALGFYVRSGFVPYKREIEISDDPRLTGVLPDTAGPHIPLIR